VNAGAEDAFGALYENGIFVKIPAKGGAGLFGVDQADGDFPLDQIG